MTQEDQAAPCGHTGNCEPRTNKEHAAQWGEGESQHISRGELQHLRLGRAGGCYDSSRWRLERAGATGSAALPVPEHS